MPRDVADTPLGGEPLGNRDFAGLMTACPGIGGERRIAVGVSGGADSMALALLAAPWARARGIALTALTVDHGLREASAQEASRVASWLAARGIAHHTLRIIMPRPASGIQRAARQWRLAAFDGWCRDNGAGAVLLAHTLEDQAETLWLRLAADSGPDGMAAMRAETRVAGLRVARPLLTVAKSRLIATLRSVDQPWIEDPSNRDRQFSRVEWRQRAARLEQLGLGAGEALRITGAMAGAREAMDRQCAAFMALHGAVSPLGTASFDGRRFAAQPDLFARLLLSRLLGAVGGGDLPPRRARVGRLAERLKAGGEPFTATLGGCIVTRRRDGVVWICREPALCAAALPPRAGRVRRWDNRFEVQGPGAGAARVGPLGEEGWRWLKHNDGPALVRTGLDGLPHAARLSIPAIHELDGSVSVPHFVAGDGVKCADPGHNVVAAFSPDADWIRALVTPAKAG